MRSDLILNNSVHLDGLDAPAPLEVLSWSVQLYSSGNEWTARIVDHSTDVPAEYAFYLMCGKERVAVRWYTREPSANFPLPTIPGSYHAIGFIRKDSSASPEVRKSGLVTKKEVPLYDLQQWKQPVFDHATGDDWPAQGQLRDGIHRFFFEGGERVDIRVDGINRFKPNGAVLVGFGGSVPKRIGKSAPFFSGIGMAGRLGVPVLAIADSSLTLSSSLALGWYAGNEKCVDLPKRIAGLLDAFAVHFQSRFVIFGGSGGGFATISVLSFLTARATAVVWNPQTSIGRYDAAAVIKYLDTAFPLPDDQSTPTIPIRLQTSGILHDLVLDHGPQRHPLLYLQNRSDKFHVDQHARPYALARRACRVSGSVFVGDDDLAFWFGNWGVGHAVPPGSMILLILHGLALGKDPRMLALQLEKDEPNDTPFEL